ncbi:MAG: RNA polymerase sigma factor [Bacteroidetes bacterium]|nr:RNA polymerase sigma factor [Bacteroidota bacterium]
MNLEELYKEHKNLVFNLALNYVQNVQDAEEITQDVFVTIHFSLHSFKAESKITTWIYRITINKSLDFIKARQRKKRFAFITSLFTTIVPNSNTTIKCLIIQVLFWRIKKQQRVFLNLLSSCQQIKKPF